MVPDSAIPAGGRTVKCGACGHQWHASAPEASHLDFASMVADAAESATAPADISIAPPETRPSLPAIIKQRIPLRPLKIAVPLLLVAWCISALYANMHSWKLLPGLSSIYALLGAENTEGLGFENVTLTPQQEGQRTRFIVAGNVVNSAAESRRVPTVRVELLKQDGEVLRSRAYAVNKMLEGGESYPFRITNVETSFGKDVARVVLDVGDDLHLSFR